MTDVSSWLARMSERGPCQLTGSSQSGWDDGLDEMTAVVWQTSTSEWTHLKILVMQGRYVPFTDFFAWFLIITVLTIKAINKVGYEPAADVESAQHCEVVDRHLLDRERPPSAGRVTAVACD